MGFKSKKIFPANGTGTDVRSEKGKNAMPNHYFKLLETMQNFSWAFREHIENELRSEKKLFLLDRKINNPNIDTEWYRFIEWDAGRHDSTQSHIVTNSLGVNLWRTLNMGKNNKGEYMFKVKNLLDFMGREESIQNKEIEKLKQMGKVDIFSSTSGDNFEEQTPKYNKALADFLASSDCNIHLYLINDNGDDRTYGTREEFQSGETNQTTRVSDIAYRNPKAFKNITILSLDSNTAHLTPALIKIIKDNGWTILFSPERRETLVTTGTDGKTPGLGNDGGNSYVTPNIFVNDITLEKICKLLNLWKIPATPHTRDGLEGGMHDFWKVEAMIRDKIKNTLPSTITIPEGKTTFKALLPKDVTDTFDENKLAIACPDGKIYDIDQEVDITFLQHYNLVEHPIQIGFKHTEKRDGTPTKTFVPKIEWNITSIE